MTDHRLIADINRLIQHPPKPAQRLDPAGSPGALPGRGTGKPAAAAGHTAGITGPLTELDYAKRQWHPEITLTSSDGVFTLQVEPIKSLALTDPALSVLIINFAVPP